MAVADYSNTPASNTSVSGINIAEGCAPSGINNALRQIMADIKDFYDAVPSLSGAETASGAWTISGAWTYTANITLNDNVAVRLGTGADTTFLHNGTNTVITDASAGLIAKTASFKVQNAAGTEDMIEAVQDSFVKLRFNNTARLTTTSTGVTITGDVVGDTISGAMVSTSIATDTGSTTKVPRVAAVEAYVNTKVRVLLATKTASASATLDFTELSNGTYRRYEFEIEDIKPATDNVSLHARTSTDGGSTYDAGASDYNYAVTGFGGGTATQAGSSAATEMQVNGGLTVGNAAAEYGVSGMLTLYGAASASVYTRLQGHVSYYNTAGNLITVQFAGSRLSAADVDAVRFFFSSGNIASGTIRMYGIV